MQAVEVFSESKTGNKDLNEDRVIVAGNYIVVIDGATSKGCPDIDGVSAGRFAALLVEEAVVKLDGGVAAREAVGKISAYFQQALKAKINMPVGAEPPSASFVAYARKQKEIWRVGDCPFVIDGKGFHAGKEIDEIASAARALAIELALRKGATVQDMMSKDVGREIILPLLKDQHMLANHAGLYGYGVINDAPVPEKFIEIVPCAGAAEIILASDGYPQVLPTLGESEAYLQQVLKEDPLLYKKYKSTKGLKSGNVSYDDRSYIRFRV